MMLQRYAKRTVSFRFARMMKPELLCTGHGRVSRAREASVAGVWRADGEGEAMHLALC